MTITYDEVLTHAEQLPLAEQARLVAQLASHIQQELAEPAPDDDSEDGEDFFGAQWAESDAEWEVLQAEWEQRRRNPPTREEAQAQTCAMLQGWFGSSMTEDEVLELAMSEELSEWNLGLEDKGYQHWMSERGQKIRRQSDKTRSKIPSTKSFSIFIDRHSVYGTMNNIVMLNVMKHLKAVHCFSQ